MSAAEALDKKIVVNSKGEPLEVIIPYGQFIDFIEAYGLDLDEEEKAGIRKAQVDIKAGNWGAFLSADEVKREIGCAE